MDDSGIMCDEIAESCEEDVKDKLHNETNLNEKMAACKMQIYVLLAFLLITIALLIAVSICCYLIKYQTKQKNLLLFHDTHKEIKQVLY